MAALYIGGEANPAPWEWTELYLCRDVYHCTPSELQQQDWATVQRHLLALEIEHEVKEAKRKEKES